MKWNDIFQMGASNLLRRKTRTLLTVLGVIIGAASIIIMLSIGFGLKASIHAQLGGTSGLTVIQVHSRGVGDAVKAKKQLALDAAAVESFKELEHVEAVSPQKKATFHFMSGRYMGDLTVAGVDSAQMEALGFKLDKGNLIRAKSDEMIFGYYAMYSLYDPKRSEGADGDTSKPPLVDVMLDKVQMTMDLQYEDKKSGAVSGYKSKVYKTHTVGVTTDTSAYAWDVYMDIAALTRLIKESEKAAGKQPGKEEKYDAILVKVDEVENVTVVQEIIEGMGYKPSSNAEYLKSIESSFNTMQMALGGIGAISLIVAAIGITNTMIMSIYERTREIGVIKVVGAAISDIRALFLFEAGLIGLSGGAAGVGLSYGVSHLLNIMLASSDESGGAPVSVIPPWLVLAALGVSFLVGIVSGYLPARRAMNLSALQAIKTE
ncbi:MAG: ABC transporter permease [Gracilibacteraceae bacterium]|jgi:ABC-type antimicrobial peptide transport system permease subunit|nr:ABC transporter permease [Gracilibacteraceae bacterium]